jgi:hypothetical protein
MENDYKGYKCISGSGIHSPSDYYDVVISSNQQPLVTLKHIENGNYKIIFNKEKFPEYTVEDFTTKFIDILESSLLKGGSHRER